MEPTETLAFQEKEKVLCYHGPLLYEAKIIRVDGSASPVKYFVHYRGWKEKWDEWVQVESIVKLDAAGLALQEKLKTSGGTQVETNEIETGEESTGEKSDEPNADGSGPIRFGRVVVPLEIVRLLNLDWRLVAKEHRLLVLPASPSAAGLIADFRSKYRKKKMVGLGVFDQFTDGLLRLFDVYLGRALLFPFERCQLSDLMQQSDKAFSPATVYAPIHLLRMLLKIPTIIDDMDLDKTNHHIAMTTRKLLDMLQRFIIEEAIVYFGKERYFLPDDAYKSRAKQHDQPPE